MWETMNADGPISRTVSDAALVLDVITGPDERDRYSLPKTDEQFLANVDGGVAGCKIAYTPNLGYAAVDVDVENITRRAAFQFEMLQCEVTEIKPDLINMENDFINFIIARSVAANAKRLDEWKKVAYPYYSSFLELEPSLKSRDIVQIEYKREELWKKMRKIFDRYDFLLTPVTAVAAYDIGTGGPVFPSKIAGKGVGPIGWMPFTYPFNLTGQPAASIPSGFTARGLPIGLQIVGRRYDDLGVLKASRAYEKRFPWQIKKPPL
jgi:aspartyl-tRNA(Asn)/glutamyl-tRNA(Gln) amidotransferase subunit A